MTASTKAAERRHSCTLPTCPLEQCRLMFGKAMGIPDLESRAKPDKGCALTDMCVFGKLFGKHDPALRIERQPLRSG